VTEAGAFYWCVKVPKTVSKDGDIYLQADEVRVDSAGALWLLRMGEDGSEKINLLLAAGSWQAIYAASVIDGHAVFVERWEGELLPT
jgi:hypothetical protein